MKITGSVKMRLIKLKFEEKFAAAQWAYSHA